MPTAPREVIASGLDALELATGLLQRARLADPEAGLWEAADLQWWWRTPRRSDAIDQIFWLDADGPVAAVMLTDWGEKWTCDPLLVPGASVPLSTVWARAVDVIKALQLENVEVLARDDDEPLTALLKSSGFDSTDDRSAITWMDADDRPVAERTLEGFILVDRAGRGAAPHPMRLRNGPAVESRLLQCSLYDPTLDLAVELQDGTAVGYALFWFDPATRVGLLEPMRVEDAYQGRGLARALIAEGLNRLVERGAQRLKVGYATEAARNLYLGAGFRVTSTSRAYRQLRRA